ncbi:MAG: tyrosine-protein phosphatase [Elusimicrobiota bacterium]
MEGLRAVLEVRREYLEAAFDEMAKAGGSIEAYLRDTLAFGEGEQARLREQLLER